MSANKKDLVQAEGVLENVDPAMNNTEVKSKSEKPAEKRAVAKKATKTATKTTKTAATKTEENVKETPAIKKTPAKAMTKKTAATKTTATKTTAAKTTKKEVEPTTIVKIQYNGKEVDQQEIMERVKADWVAKGNDLKDMKTLATYIKPEEESVYYAVNDELNSGRIDF